MLFVGGDIAAGGYSRNGGSPGVARLKHRLTPSCMLRCLLPAGKALAQKAAGFDKSITVAAARWDAASRCFFRFGKPPCCNITALLHGTSLCLARRCSSPISAINIASAAIVSSSHRQLKLRLLAACRRPDDRWTRFQPSSSADPRRRQA